MASTGPNFGLLVKEFAQAYQRTPTKLKLIDFFLSYVMLTGIAQFVYCALVGTFPFNSFLSGFICTVGVFVLTGVLCPRGAAERPAHVAVLTGYARARATRTWCPCCNASRACAGTVSLRLHLTSPDLQSSRSPQRAFAEYVFCNLILFLVVMNFMG